MTRHVVVLMTLLGACAAAPASAQDWQSRPASRLLLEQMDLQKSEAIAVRDPERPDRFMAALRLPGQLLVVSATHPSTDLVAQRLQQGQYREVYLDLQGTPARDSQFVVHDMAADGLSLEGRGAAYDVVRDGALTLTCDGRWKDAKLKEDVYRDRLSQADARYARILGLLASAMAPVATAR
ncbi:MAG TPA: hypothetical protein VMF13_16460 [Luteitalea sp.]|nr:hypothetical protein [Luteitalea sp.]